MRYALLASGRPLAFYAEDVHGPRFLSQRVEVDRDPLTQAPVYAVMTAPNPDCLIPAEAAAISDDAWRDLLAQPGSRYVEGRILPPEPPAPPSLEKAKKSALAQLAERRWRAETGGIVFGGVAVATDRESQALISGAWIGAQIDSAQVIEWKGVGGWMELDAAAIAAVGLAVRNHVQSCFSLEKAKAAEIEAMETVEAVEAWLAAELEAGWPTTSASAPN